jgi:DNA-binding MarR family transcriptional regulator
MTTRATVEDELLNYMSLLRDFGRIYTQRIVGGSPRGESDLKLSHIRALYAFRDQDRLSMKELAANIGVKLPTMTMMVDSLAREGLIGREHDANDRRRVIVWLTPKGKKVRKDFLAQRHDIAATIFKRLNQQDRHKLLRSLGDVCGVLEKAFSNSE